MNSNLFLASTQAKKTEVQHFICLIYFKLLCFSSVFIFSSYSQPQTTWDKNTPQMNHGLKVKRPFLSIISSSLSQTLTALLSKTLSFMHWAWMSLCKCEDSVPPYSAYVTSDLFQRGICLRRRWACRSHEPHIGDMRTQNRVRLFHGLQKTRTVPLLNYIWNTNFCFHNLLSAATLKLTCKHAVW